MENQESHPLVSVILTTFNREKFISKAIESVLNQTYSNLELLVVDDGSRDHTKSIVNTYSKSLPEKVRYFYKANGGQASALNFGLQRAKGAYICFLDSDDQYKSFHIETHLNNLLEGSLDFTMGTFELKYNGPEPFVIDYYHPTKTIPLSQTEASLGVMFGKSEVFRNLGGFKDKLVDIDFFDRMKSSHYKWGKVHTKTYDYFYGLCENSLLMEYTLERGKENPSKRLVSK